MQKGVCDMREEKSEDRDMEKRLPAAWELHCLQFIYQWFDGAVFPIKENCEALSELICT